MWAAIMIQSVGKVPESGGGEAVKSSVRGNGGWRVDFLAWTTEARCKKRLGRYLGRTVEENWLFLPHLEGAARMHPTPSVSQAPGVRACHPDLRRAFRLAHSTHAPPTLCPVVLDPVQHVGNQLKEHPPTLAGL